MSYTQAYTAGPTALSLRVVTFVARDFQAVLCFLKAKNITLCYYICKTISSSFRAQYAIRGIVNIP